jgi:Fe2+ or Zn2+ uptake regulation protein
MAERHSELARQILRYLVTRPDAQDTVRGIASWWLMREAVERGVEAVQTALQQLVDDGLVIEHQSGVSQARYQLNSKRSAEVERFLLGDKG